MLSHWPMQIRPKPVIGQHSDWYFQWTHGVDLPSIRLALVMPGGGLRTVAVTFYAPSFPQPCAWAHHSPDHTAAHSSSQLTAWSRPHSTQFLRTCNGRPPFHSRTYIEVVPIRYRPTFQTQNCQIWTEKIWGPMFLRLNWFFAHSPKYKFPCGILKAPCPHMGPFIVSTSLCVNPEEVSGAISLLALTNQPKTNRRKLPKWYDGVQIKDEKRTCNRLHQMGRLEPIEQLCEEIEVKT